MSGGRGPGVPFSLTFTTDTVKPDRELWFRGRKTASLVTAPFRSAYTEMTLRCPDCQRDLVPLGERYGCEGCGGVFVETAALQMMVEDMTRRPWPPPPSTGATGARCCPVCASKMVVDLVEGEVVERCAPHGFWFDPDELGAMLSHSASAPEGPVARLRRLLFG
jgi:hypothetical protein